MKSMITEKFKSLSLTALLIASATFVACSGDDNITEEQPVQPVQPQVYTMTVDASKGGDAADSRTTRALSLSGSTLNATWATTEHVYVKKGDTWASGSLQPQANGATATLKGTLSGITISADDNLTLQFPKSGNISYDGQVGTLADIAANFDYATATVQVESVSATGNINPKAATTAFVNQQAIVKFTLVDKSTNTAINATELNVSDGTSTYTVTPSSATDVLYMALPGFSGQTVTLSATVGSSTYTYEKANVTFANGQYYAITVKMTEQSASARALTEATPEDIGKIIGEDGKIYATQEAAEAAGTIAVAKIAYVGSEAETSTTYNHGLALALSDVSDRQKWCSQTDEICLTTQYDSEYDAKTDMAGIANTDYLINNAPTGHTHNAASAARNYNSGTHPTGTSAWFLPSAGQWDKMATAAGGYDKLGLESSFYWSSSERSANRAWGFYADVGFWLNVNKVDDGLVRACLAF